jgi:hypothetical protein
MQKLLMIVLRNDTPEPCFACKEVFNRIYSTPLFASNIVF